MTDQPAPYAHALERLGSSIEKQGETLETVRARLHDMANHISTSNMQLATISATLSHIERSSSDHELRLRHLEEASPKELVARLKTVEDAVVNIRLRMALWTGGGSVIGAIAGALLPQLWKGSA